MALSHAEEAERAQKLAARQSSIGSLQAEAARQESDLKQTNQSASDLRQLKSAKMASLSKAEANRGLVVGRLEGQLAMVRQSHQRKVAARHHATALEERAAAKGRQTTAGEATVEDASRAFDNFLQVNEDARQATLVAEDVVIEIDELEQQGERSDNQIAMRRTQRDQICCQLQVTKDQAAKVRAEAQAEEQAAHEMQVAAINSLLQVEQESNTIEKSAAWGTTRAADDKPLLGC